MKKMLSLVLAIGLASIPVVAESPSVDLSAMTLDELVELRDRVSFEIDSRIYSDNSVIGSGEYTVGTLIAPGIYEFTATEVQYYDFISGTDSICNLTVYEIDADGNRVEKTCIYHVRQSSVTIIELRDGEIFEISGGSGILRKANRTWMPQK